MHKDMNADSRMEDYMTALVKERPEEAKRSLLEFMAATIEE
jgi:hypothetical protein